MSLDRAGQYSAGGFMGQLPNRSFALPPGPHFGNSWTGADWVPAVASAGSKAADSFVDHWAHDTFKWGARQALGKLGDHYLSSPNGNQPPIRASANSGGFGGPPPTMPDWSYQKLLHLGDESVELRHFSLNNLIETAKRNVTPFLERAKSALKGEVSFWDEGVTPKTVLKNTVLGENAKPIQNLFEEGAEQKIGSGLVKAAGLGLMAYGIFDETRRTYEEAKAQEDGSLGSQLHTLVKTGGTLIGKTLKSAVSWEFTTLVCAAAQAVLPVAVAGIPVVGIAVGALAGVALNHVMNEAIPTGPSQPEPNPPSPEQAAPILNAFQNALI